MLLEVLRVLCLNTSKKYKNVQFPNIGLEKIIKICYNLNMRMAQFFDSSQTSKVPFS